MKVPSKLPFAPAIFALGVACLSAAALLALVTFLGRGGSDGSQALRVAIRAPSSGARVSVGDSTVVLLQSSGVGPVVRYELWVDGLAQGVILPEPGQAWLPPTTQIAWRPADPGPHSLVARAFTGRGDLARSVPIVLEAAAPPDGERIAMDVPLRAGDTLESVGAAFGVAPEDLQAANPGWSGEPEAGREIRVLVPADDLPADYLGDDGERDPAPESSPDQPAPEPPAGSPSRPGTPSATRKEVCRVDLAWSPSRDSDGYRVYRFGGGQMDFTAIGETASDDLSFEDVVPLAGTYQYLISAFNEQGSADGDPVAIEVPADQCPESSPLPDNGMAWLDVELLSFIPMAEMDQAYCYVSPLPGAAYVRIPADEDSFFTPSEGVWDIGRFATGLQRLGLYHPADQPVHLETECWGWRGDDLSRLGQLELEHPRSDWDGRQLSAASQDFEMLYRIFSHTNEVPQLAPVIFGFGPPRPEYFRRPESITECLENVARYGGDGGGPAFAGALACLTVDPHDLAIWDWSERADPRYTRHDLQGFHLYVDHAGREAGEIPRSEWEFYADADPSPQVFPLLAPPCGETYSYWATSFGAGTAPFPDPGSSGEGPGFQPPIPGGIDPISPVMESDASSTLYATGPDCPVEEVLVEITLDQLEVGRTWDSCFDIDFECEDVWLETYGSGTFFVVDEDGNSEQVASVSFWGSNPGCPAMTACLSPGSVGAHDTLELASEDLAVCDVDGCDSMGPGNNAVRIWVGDGDNIIFDFSLWDQDDDSGDDIWCGTTDDASGWGGAGKSPAETRGLDTGARSAEAWADLDGAAGAWDNEGLDRQDAECTMTFFTTAVEVQR